MCAGGGADRVKVRRKRRQRQSEKSEEKGVGRLARSSFSIFFMCKPYQSTLRDFFNHKSQQIICPQ